MSIKNRVILIVASLSLFSAAMVSLDNSIDGDLLYRAEQWDELLVELQEAYGNIDAEKLLACKTVGDVVRLVKQSQKGDA